MRVVHRCLVPWAPGSERGLAFTEHRLLVLSGICSSLYRITRKGPSHEKGLPRNPIGRAHGRAAWRWLGFVSGLLGLMLPRGAGSPAERAVPTSASKDALPTPPTPRGAHVCFPGNMHNKPGRGGGRDAGESARRCHLSGKRSAGCSQSAEEPFIFWPYHAVSRGVGTPRKWPSTQCHAPRQGLPRPLWWWRVRDPADAPWERTKRVHRRVTCSRLPWLSDTRWTCEVTRVAAPGHGDLCAQDKLSDQSLPPTPTGMRTRGHAPPAALPQGTPLGLCSLLLPGFCGECALN